MNVMSLKGFAAVPLIFLILIILSVPVYFFRDSILPLFVKSPPARESLAIPASPSPSPAVKSPYDNFFLFSIPKPIEKLSVYQLPNDLSPRNVIKYKDSLWFSGDGSLVEYDIKSGKLKSYTDMTKANCTSEIVMVNGYIFVACYVDNIDDAFGNVNILKTPVFTGSSAVFKINPDTHKVEYVYSKENGVLNAFNHVLYADKGYIWLSTFSGVARINPDTNKVDFYREQLNIPGGSEKTTYNVVNMFVDSDYIWVAVSANVGSVGGLALFDKQNGTWKSFTARDLKDYKPDDRFDMETPFKSVPGGMQIGFRDGAIGTVDRFVEKQYNYQTGKWTKLGEQRATGSFYEDLRKHIDSVYPSKPGYQVIDQDGLTQIKLPGEEKIYKLDGRNNFILSRSFGDKRYVLTNATVDVIDNNSEFRKILVKLGSRLESAISVSDISFFESLVNFLIDQQGEWAIVTDSDCGGMGCTGNQKVWLIDLKMGEVQKAYVGEKDGVPAGELLMNLSMSRENDKLIIKDKNSAPLFNIDLKSYNLTAEKK